MAERVKLGQLKKGVAVKIQLRSSYFLVDAVYTGRMKDSDFSGAPEEWWRCFRKTAKVNCQYGVACWESAELILRESRHGVDWIVWGNAFYKTSDAQSVTWEEEQHE